MKKFLMIGLVLLIVFIIYLCNMDRKVYYLSLGNSSKYLGDVYGYSFYVSDYLKQNNLLEKYVYQYSGKDERIPDIINDIKNNKRFKENTLKNSLIKADLVTLSISGVDVFDKIKYGEEFSDIYDYIDELTVDFEKLIETIREYCKEDIVFVGYYNPFSGADSQDVIDYFNKRYKEVCQMYDVKFVFTDDLKLSLNGYDLDAKSNKFLADNIIKIMNKSLFKG